MSTETETTAATPKRAVTPAGMNSDAAPPAAGALVYKLEYPIEFDGQRVTEFRMNFANLSGSDVIQCERTFRLIFPEDSATIPKMASGYWWTVAARAADVNHALYTKLKMPDFDAIVLSAMQAMGTPVSLPRLTG
jgi:hypothetical protein